ncbi:MAG: efflux RND transporter permease subunit [Candidatus Thiodiazotropha sp.]
MKVVVDYFFSRTRTVLLSLFFVLLTGIFSFENIPKESEPDIAIPTIYVSMTHEGLSTEDAERLLLRPMERELQSLKGLERITSTSVMGYASIQLEFNAGFDSIQALNEVREKVDIAKSDLPDATEEPEVMEVNISQFSVLTVYLSGELSASALLSIARDLKDKIEKIPNVFEAVIGGRRDDLVEIIVDPVVMATYGIQFNELLNIVHNNNKLVAAGAIDSAVGRMIIKVPGKIEDINDVLNMPIKVDRNHVVTFNEIAKIKKSYKDIESITRVDGLSAITVEVKKRVGANIIDTIESIKGVVQKTRDAWPDGLRVAYLQDRSHKIQDILSDLQNNILSALVLVMVVVIFVLGPRSALLVSLSIPGSLLATIIVLYAMGYTLNIVVLFGMILVVGMLVDGAIVITELANRCMCKGDNPVGAYSYAAKRMSWPIVVSTATTLAVFIPLIFWPGTIGKYMVFLPITVVIALIASLLIAIIFIPVLGNLVTKNNYMLCESNNGAFVRAYVKILKILVRHPGKVIIFTLLSIFVSYKAYVSYGKGFEFFPDIEPEFSLVQVHARGNLSIYEKDSIVRQVENIILDIDGIKDVYSQSFNNSSGDTMAEDVVGFIQVGFAEWYKRRQVKEIIDEVRRKAEEIPGIEISILNSNEGPASEKPIQIEFSASDVPQLNFAVNEVRELMLKQGGYVDIEDSRSLSGVEWHIEIDRTLAARYGADITMLGNIIQMLTNGIKLTEYQPNDADDDVDIVLRFPKYNRNYQQLEQLWLPTDNGVVPVSNFVRIYPKPKSGALKRVDGQRVITLLADVETGTLPHNKLKQLKGAISEAKLSENVTIKYKGQGMDQSEATEFLIDIFIGSIFLMVLILVTLFNSIYQSIVVLSAILLSTIGVLLELLITGQPFDVVMVGLGIIALAGIVVNNNIILIDTYNRLRKNGFDVTEAVLETGRRRFRPVLLTAATTVLGLMPMVLSMSIDIVNRSIAIGGPSTQMWTQLASAIAGGLTFATLLTLVVTPCLLIAGEKIQYTFKLR